MEGWTFLTNHGHVLLSIAADPDIRLRDVAVKVGITERAAQRIVADLIDGGYLSSTKVGRRNHYKVHPGRPLRHPVERHRPVQALLALASYDVVSPLTSVPVRSKAQKRADGGVPASTAGRTGTK